MKYTRGFPDYLITEDGRVFSEKSGKWLKNSDNGHGYRYLVLRRGGKSYNKYVHRLVAEAYLGENTLPVNHKDGDKSNNCLSNLEYVTPSENTRHGFAKGLMHTAPVTLEKDGFGYWFPTQKGASSFLGVCRSAINQVVKGRNKTVKQFKLVTK